MIRGKSLPGTTEFDPGNVCYFRHALALDECRVKFLPKYVCGGETYEEKGSGATSRVKEVWFAGCHSDMCISSFTQPTYACISNRCWHSGGGSMKNTELNNAAVPVIWMGNEALFAGLKLTVSRVVWDWNTLEQTRPKESLTWVWRFFELLPFRRLSYDKSGKTW